MKTKDEDYIWSTLWKSIGIVLLIGIIIGICFATDKLLSSYKPPIEGVDYGVGHRGGHWHITSGGNKSYYRPLYGATRNSNGRACLGWGAFLAVLAGLLIMLVFYLVVLICVDLKKRKEMRLKTEQIKNKVRTWTLEEETLLVKYYAAFRAEFRLDKIEWTRHAKAAIAIDGIKHNIGATRMRLQNMAACDTASPYNALNNASKQTKALVEQYVND